MWGVCMLWMEVYDGEGVPCHEGCEGDSTIISLLHENIEYQ